MYLISTSPWKLYYIRVGLLWCSFFPSPPGSNDRFFWETSWSMDCLDSSCETSLNFNMFLGRGSFHNSVTLWNVVLIITSIFFLYLHKNIELEGNTVKITYYVVMYIIFMSDYSENHIQYYVELPCRGSVMIFFFNEVQELTVCLLFTFNTTLCLNQESYWNLLYGWFSKNWKLFY